VEDSMFRDEDELVRVEILGVLENYDIYDILDLNDMTPEEAVLKLYMDGHITLPEVKPL
jgi:hypothetical protein